jgi:hypothetical protein
MMDIRKGTGQAIKADPDTAAVLERQLAVFCPPGKAVMSAFVWPSEQKSKGRRDQDRVDKAMIRAARYRDCLSLIRRSVRSPTEIEHGRDSAEKIHVQQKHNQRILSKPGPTTAFRMSCDGPERKLKHRSCCRSDHAMAAGHANRIQ